MLKEFSHGGGVEQFARDINCKVNEVIDLSSNINFIKPDINIDFNTLDISSYPTYDSLEKIIANKYKISKDNLELFNGGSSAIFTLFSHLDLTHCTIYSPAYLEYKKAATKFKYAISLINRFDSLDANIQENSLVIFVNPSTPDGSFYNIETLLEKWANKNCTVFIDESFLDFTEYKSVTKYLEKYDKLYILKSMTKFYSSAGVRVGCIVSSANNIEKLREDEPMWKISQFDKTYLEEALKDTKFPKIAKAINAKNNILLKEILEKSKLFDIVVPSDANFILAKLKNITASQLQEKLKSYKIMIRDCSNFDFLDEGYVRIAVKSEENLRAFQIALNS